MSDFQAYAPDLPRQVIDNIWYETNRDDYRDSLFATHQAALLGNVNALRTMKLFRMALITHRLKS